MHRIDSAYCNNCGKKMTVSEVNFSYCQYTCHACGNTFTSHSGSIERLKAGRQIRYDHLIAGGNQVLLDQFRQEEIRRVARLSVFGGSNYSDEELAKWTPFGAEIIPEIREAMAKRERELEEARS